jgi:hypothetical protein
VASFKSTTIEFEGQQQQIDDLISRARYHAQTNRAYSLEIILHLQDHAFQLNDFALFEKCRELMVFVQSPSPYLVHRDHQHASDDNNRPTITESKQTEIPYDEIMDRIFDPRVNPKAVKKTLDTITTFSKTEHRFWFVLMKVLIHLQWIPADTKIKDFLRWANLQYNLGWTTKRQFSFSDIGGNTIYGRLIKDADITQWHLISDKNFRDIQKYSRFALLLKTTFVHIIVNGMEQKTVTDLNAGKPLDRVQFMKKPNELINWGK